VDNPTALYHGSLYKQTELMPGFKRSGELTVWDGVESNIFLYATSNKQEACLLGIGSAAEKTFNSERFIELEGDIWVFTSSPISIDEFLKMEIYCYTLPFRDNDGWKKNNNPYNNIDTEWKTKNTIRDVQVEQVDIRTVMKGKRITLTTAPADTDLPHLVRQYGSSTKIFKM